MQNRQNQSIKKRSTNLQSQEAIPITNRFHTLSVEANVDATDSSKINNLDPTGARGAIPRTQNTGTTSGTTMRKQEDTIKSNRYMVTDKHIERFVPVVPGKKSYVQSVKKRGRYPGTK